MVLTLAKRAQEILWCSCNTLLSHTDDARTAQLFSPHRLLFLSGSDSAGFYSVPLGVGCRGNVLSHEPLLGVICSSLSGKVLLMSVGLC